MRVFGFLSTPRLQVGSIRVVFGFLSMLRNHVDQVRVFGFLSTPRLQVWSSEDFWLFIDTEASSGVN